MKGVGDCGLSDSGGFVPALAAMARLYIPDVRICNADIARKMFSRLYAFMGEEGAARQVCQGIYAIWAAMQSQLCSCWW